MPSYIERLDEMRTDIQILKALSEVEIKESVQHAPTSRSVAKIVVKLTNAILLLMEGPMEEDRKEWLNKSQLCSIEANSAGKTV